MKSVKFKPVLLSSLIVIFFAWLQISSNTSINAFRERLEYLAYDIRLNLLIDNKSAKDERIVIVDIDENSCYLRYINYQDKIEGLDFYNRRVISLNKVGLALCKDGLLKESK